MVPYVFSDFEFFDINNQPMLIPGTGYIWTDPDGPCDSIPTNLNFVLTEPTFSMTVTPLQIEGDPNTWSGAAVLTPILVPGVNVFYPKYYVLSLLYAAPGNMSSDGFTDAQTQGATSSISETFTQGTTTSASFGFFDGVLGISEADSMNASNTYTSSFTNTISNASGLTLKSSSNSVDHTQDTFELWLNPMVVVGQTGPASGVYFVNTPQSEPADVITVNVKELQNPSLIPASKLGQQTIDGVSLPGLSSICANPNQCTAADFAAIVSYDGLANANPTAAPSNTTRYARLLTAQGTGLTVTLQGPDCSACDLVTNTYSITDANTTAATHSNSLSESESYSGSVGTPGGLGFTLRFTETGTWTWTYASSVGTIDGQSNQASASLASSTIACEESIDVYMDTIFHTIVFVQPTNNGGCD